MLTNPRLRRATALIVITAVLATVGALLSRKVHAEEVTPAKFDTSIQALLSKMTLEEKASQLFMAPRGGDAPAYITNDLSSTKLAGAVFNFTTPEQIAAVHKMVAESRLKIPVLFGLDIVRGYKMLYPVPLAEAALFDPEMARQSSELAAREAVANGQRLTFAPIADLARDARWGRVSEGAGEDPMLGALYAKARVEGLHQGGLATTLKHFAGYGGVEAGLDYGPVEMSMSEIRSRYLAGFRAGLAAGTDVVMSSFVALNGHPSTGNHELLTGLLRDELGFGGFVMSDFNAIAELVNQGVAVDAKDAARQAFEAGVDMDMQSGLYPHYLPELVRRGVLSMAALDRSVAHVLALKQRLGLFDAKPLDAAQAAAETATPAMRAFARKEAAATMVLLRNEKNTLPITSAVHSIAVVGGFAKDGRTTLGPQFATAVESDATTTLAGITTRAQAAGISVSYVEGCGIYCFTDDGFAAATIAAKAADLTVVVVGETIDLSSEGGSRASVELPGRQADLVRAVAASGKPFVVVVLSGRPLALSSIVPLAPAILDAWYPGTEGGHAIADVLFGDADPQARLPVTFPRVTGQVPLTYNSYTVGRPADPNDHFTHKYADLDVGPLYPFGYGLTYSTVDYSAPKLSATALHVKDVLTATLTLHNTGARPSTEVVQLYMHQKVGSRTHPVRELKGFTKVTLGAGERREVAVAVPIETFGYWPEDGSYQIEPGEYEIYLGRDSTAPLVGTVKVLDGLTRSADALKRELVGGAATAQIGR